MFYFVLIFLFSMVPSLLDFKMKGGDSMLTIENLYKSFGKLVAVNDFNLHVKEGETAVLIVPSGCGKSTMIRMINRLIEPDSGRICVSGTEITKLDLEE